MFYITANLYIAEIKLPVYTQIWVDWRRFVLQYLFSNILKFSYKLSKVFFIEFLFNYVEYIFPSSVVVISVFSIEFRKSKSSNLAPIGASILLINVTREGCVYKKILRTAGQLVMKK